MTEQTNREKALEALSDYWDEDENKIRYRHLPNTKEAQVYAILALADAVREAAHSDE